MHSLCGNEPIGGAQDGTRLIGSSDMPNALLFTTLLGCDQISPNQIQPIQPAVKSYFFCLHNFHALVPIFDVLFFILHTIQILFYKIIYFNFHSIQIWIEVNLKKRIEKNVNNLKSDTIRRAIIRNKFTMQNWYEEIEWLSINQKVYTFGIDISNWRDEGNEMDIGYEYQATAASAFC